MKKLLILIVMGMSMVACSDRLVITNAYPDYYYFNPTPIIIHHYNYSRYPFRPMIPPPPKPRHHYSPNNNYRRYGNYTFENRQSRFENRHQTRPGNTFGRFGSPRR